MGNRLATKADLHQFRAEMGREFVLLRRDIQAFGTGFRRDIQGLESGLRRDLQALESGFRKDLELFSATITLRFGYMLVIGLGVLFAALKLT
jgi:hypothetical protein